MIKQVLLCCFLLVAIPLQAKVKGETKMFEAIKLPYETTIFEPAISKSTFDFHYGKHYQAYLDNLNKFVSENEALQGKSLEEIIKMSYNNPDMVAVFNNAAQVYNHEFYFKNLRPISADLKNQIIADFGSIDAFKQAWKIASLAQFGSGWVWLIEKDGKLEIVKTLNADTPLAQGHSPLLTIDVWEHAYYIDYQNRRGDYVDTFLNITLN